MVPLQGVVASSQSPVGARWGVEQPHPAEAGHPFSSNTHWLNFQRNRHPPEQAGGSVVLVLVVVLEVVPPTHRGVGGPPLAAHPVTVSSQFSSPQYAGGMQAQLLQVEEISTQFFELFRQAQRQAPSQGAEVVVVVDRQTLTWDSSM